MLSVLASQHNYVADLPVKNHRGSVYVPISMVRSVSRMIMLNIISICFNYVFAYDISKVSANSLPHILPGRNALLLKTFRVIFQKHSRRLLTHFSLHRIIIVLTC